MKRHEEKGEGYGDEEDKMSRFSDWLYYNKDKFISLIITFVYIVIAGFISSDNSRYSLKSVDQWSQFTAVILIPSLACIWFGEVLGKVYGTIRLQQITKETPGCLMIFLGWVLLLLPIPYGVLLAIGAFN